MKELDQETADLLKSLDQRQRGWRRNPGVIVWAFWIGDDQAKAKAWAEEHELDNIVFGVISPDDPALAAWHLHPQATNSHVLSCRSKLARTTFTDLTTADLNKLHKRLAELVKRRD